MINLWKDVQNHEVVEKFKPSYAVDAWRRTTHSSILAWRIPWTEEPGRLEYMGLQRAGHHWETNTLTVFSYAIDGNAKSCNCYGKQYGNSSKHLKENYVPEIPLLDIYPNELEWESQRNIYLLIFIAALYATTKIQKNKSKCPSMKEQNPGWNVDCGKWI